MTAAAPLALVIPAYQPGPVLAAIVRGVIAADDARLFRQTIVVDDGSDPPHAAVFAAIARLPGVEIVRHSANRGKGAALKTALASALAIRPPLTGVITADADGQHTIRDILKVGRALLDAPDRLVLGVRTFDAAVPLRSRVGNVFTRRLVRLLTGADIGDTQTGLRGLPMQVCEANLRCTSNRYEYELETLLAALHTPVSQVPIETIYEPGNRSSHFRPLTDSLRVFAVLARHAVARRQPSQ